MFKNIHREMAANRLTIISLSKQMGICAKTLSDKINGKREFTRKEMFEMQRIFGCNITLDKLFEWTE